MEALVPRKRISAQDRRQSILVAARKTFAERGYEGAKTLQIAAASGVSEALLYRHFASKEALYRAVLRQMIRDQNQMYEVLGVPEASTASLVLVIRAFLRSCIDTASGSLREGVRIMLASLAGDGTYAGLVYRRAIRMQLAPIGSALDAARAAGDSEGHSLSPQHVGMLVEHVGTMIAAAKALPGALSPYNDDPDQMLTDATWFCCRGIGLTNAAITLALASETGVVPKLTGVRPRRASVHSLI